MYFFKSICLLFLFRNVFCVLESDNLPLVVDAPVGQIQGQKFEYYSMYLGIPYGVVDENNPFGPATPYPNFTSPYQALNDSIICPQIVNGIAVGTIHCLRLNVYTPNTETKGRILPVMVYIHGGAFVEGNGREVTYSPKNLIRHDVIVVSIQYRLGPYGHFCWTNSEFSNQGLKDQQLALKWIKNNIKSFGGDDENITLFGHSSGAASVNLHLFFNNDRLFNKVVLQSGAAVSPYCQLEPNKKFVEKLSKTYNFDTKGNINEFIKKISNIDPKEIIELTKYDHFAPCVDGIFVKNAPNETNIKNTKIMIGGTDKEALYFYFPINESFTKNFDFVAELDRGFKMAADITDVVKHFYSKDIIDFVSDFAFNYPMERTVKYFIENNATVYRYLFAYDGGRNYMKIRENITADGATHGDELGYVFDMPTMFSSNVSMKDQLVIDRMTLLWTNFAKYGDPTPTPSPLVPVKWKPVTSELKPYLQIDSDIQLLTNPFEKRMAFWDLFYQKYEINSKGISLGEKWKTCYENKSHVVGLSKLLMFLSVIFVLY